MQRFQAYKFELMPNGEQARKMRQFAGACRFVYNKALALQQENYAAGNKMITYAAMAKHLTAWRNSKETPWLNDASAQALQQALKNLDFAYTSFFQKRCGYPQFKKKGSFESFRFPQGFKLDQSNSRIFLPKIGWVRYRNSRVVQGELRNVIASFSGGKWSTSIQTRRDVEQPVHPSDTIVGVDAGVAKFATLSNGTEYESCNSFRKNEERLAKATRRMSRKNRFSNNWKKAKAKVNKIHTKIVAVRRNHLHKTSAEISKNHAIVVIEDLKVSNMSRSAAGTVENPGRYVRVKAGLNKTILDQGWAGFRRMLEYKQLWRGGLVVAVSAMNTSRTCPSCTHVSKKNRKTQAKFLCVECGFAENADLVGAINILRAGHARLACEVSGAVMPPATGTHRSA